METSVITSYLLTIAISTLTFYLVYKQLKLYSFWRSKGINGPTPWPLVGTSIHYLFRNRIDVDHEWREKYGRVYGTYEGSDPVLRITDCDLIKHVWIKDHASFTDRNRKYIFGDNISRWLFWSSGKHWSNQRVLITPVFASSYMKSMFNTMSSCIDKFMVEVSSKMNVSKETQIKSEDKKAIENEEGKGSFSKDDFMSLTLDVIAQSFFSLKLDTYKDKTSEFFRRAFAFASFDVPRFLLWICVPSFIARRLKFDITGYNQFEYFDRLSSTIIEERRNNPKTNRKDIIQALLDARLTEIKEEQVFTKDDDHEFHYNAKMDHKELEQMHKSQMGQLSRGVTFRQFEDIEIRAHMTFFFLAGFETTSSSLSLCFYVLAQDQQVQNEVYEEIRSSHDLSKHFDYSELSSLKKLNAFVSETLRLYCPVTEHNRMVTAKEGVVLPTNPPIRLPYGCVVSSPGFELQRDSEYWPDPLKFDMTRFYPENKDKIRSGSYLPFGIGPRNCVGMRFALLQIKLLLARVLLKYRIVPDPKTQQYPPEFNRHAFFLQLKNSDFKLIERQV